MQLEYRANGKLLLTAEYYVLHGSEALVLPTWFGQNLVVKTGERTGKNHILWTAKESGETWFSAVFDTNLNTLETSDEEKAEFLKNILKNLQILSPGCFDKLLLYTFTTHIDFHRMWGLGSSSTLIRLLADWAGVDPYLLHARVSSGSGYDIAAAGTNEVFIYRRNGEKISVRSVALSEALTEMMYFVYLGRKEPTEQALNHYRLKGLPSKQEVEHMSALTRKFAGAANISELSRIVKKHENMVADRIGSEPVKKRLFNDYPFPVKSLGAWGGDFVLFLNPEGEEVLRNYLKTKNLNTCLKYTELAKR